MAEEGNQVKWVSCLGSCRRGQGTEGTGVCNVHLVIFVISDTLIINAGCLFFHLHLSLKGLSMNI